jgi:hypothetical protein
MPPVRLPDERIAAASAVASGGVVVLPDGTSGFTTEWEVPDKVLIRSTTAGIRAQPTWVADPVTAGTPLLRGKVIAWSPLTRGAFNLTDVVVVAAPTYYAQALAKEFCTTPTTCAAAGCRLDWSEPQRTGSISPARGPQPSHPRSGRCGGPGCVRPRGLPFRRGDWRLDTLDRL